MRTSRLQQPESSIKVDEVDMGIGSDEDGDEGEGATVYFETVWRECYEGRGECWGSRDNEIPYQTQGHEAKDTSRINIAGRWGQENDVLGQE